MTIQYLQRKEIDDHRWDEVITSSVNSLPYALSWYLDITAQARWSALVLGDYACVMPLPWNSKLFGLKQIYQPFFSQQLGIFGKRVEAETVLAFISSVPNKFKYVHYCLNSANSPSLLDGTEIKSRTNLVLNLQNNIEALRSNYSKSLRKRLRAAEPDHLPLTSCSTGDILNFYRENLKGQVGLNDRQYAIIDKLMSECLARETGEAYALYDQQEKLRANGFFLHWQGRVVNLFGSSDLRGKDLNSMHLLLDSVIARWAEKKYLFDFEGSEIPGVAAFFKSFGASEESYYTFRKNRLPFPVNLLKG